MLRTHHTRVFREPKEEVEHVATPHPVMEGVIVWGMLEQSGFVTHPVVLEVRSYIEGIIDDYLEGD